MSRKASSLGAALLLGACAGIARLDDPVASFPVLMVCCALATAGWLIGWWSVRRTADSHGDVRLVIAVSLAARLLLLMPAVPLSDDLYRYLWDGRVANAGTNPFLYTPADDALRSLRDEVIWPRINHPTLLTLYPPTAQLYFRALDVVAPHPRGPRLAAALLDVVTTALLAALLGRRGHSRSLALAYGWCPLAILETGGAGHVDALGVALLLVGLLALEAKSARGALAGGLLLGLSVLVKPIAALLAPCLLGPGVARRGRIVVGAGIAMLLWLPYVGAGEHLVAGFRNYAENWHFNDALFSRLVAGGLSPRHARRVLGAALAAVALLAARRGRDPLAASGWVLGSFLALSPTVHPWYAMWLASLLPFVPRLIRPAAITLCALLPLSYATPWERCSTGVWREPSWPRAAIWGCTAVLLAASLAASLFSRATSRGASPSPASVETRDRA